MMTIKQLAEELHISQQAVSKKLKNYKEELEAYVTFERGIYLFDDEGLEILRNLSKRKKRGQLQLTTQLNNQINQLTTENNGLKLLLEEKERYILSLGNDKIYLIDQLNKATVRWWQKFLPYNKK